MEALKSKSKDRYSTCYKIKQKLVSPQKKTNLEPLNLLPFREVVTVSFKKKTFLEILIYAKQRQTENYETPCLTLYSPFMFFAILPLK